MDNNTNTFHQPSVACDIVAIDTHLAAYREDGAFMNLILIKRDANTDAYPNTWALPGGFLEADETLEQCAVREFKEETGLDAKLLAPIGVFSNPQRDPRCRVISSAYMTMLMSTDKYPLQTKAGDDSEEVAIFNIKGKFNNEDCTSLSLKLRCVENGAVISYTTEFNRGMNGVISAEVTYHEESTTKLAFDHAEMIARAVLRAPDIVKRTKPIEHSPIVHVEPNPESDAEIKKKIAPTLRA